MNFFLRWHRRLYLWGWRAFGGAAILAGCVFILEAIPSTRHAIWGLIEDQRQGELVTGAALGVLLIPTGIWVLRRKPFGWTSIYPDA